MTICEVPRDVIENADITFSCLSDPKSVKGVNNDADHMRVQKI